MRCAVAISWARFASRLGDLASDGSRALQVGERASSSASWCSAAARAALSSHRILGEQQRAGRDLVPAGDRDFGEPAGQRRGDVHIVGLDVARPGVGCRGVPLPPPEPGRGAERDEQQ